MQREPGGVAVDDVEPGRRARKKQATRDALAGAALRLALERGPANVTVEAISDLADVSVRTFFNHFGSKEEAILGADPDRPRQLRARLEARPPGEPPLEALRVALTEASATQVEDAEVWTAKMRLVREHPSLVPRYLAGYADAERGLVEAVAARAGVDPDRHLYPSLVVAAALNATRAAVNHWDATGRDASLTALLREAFDQLADGLAPPAPDPARPDRRPPDPASARPPEPRTRTM